MTYIVRFYGDPELGILDKEAPKTYIVQQVIPIQGELRPMGGLRRWPKEQCGIATEMTVDLLAEYRHLARSYRKRIEDLRKEGREHEKPLIERMRASTQTVQGPHEHKWYDAPKGTRCYLCGDYAISQEEAERGLESLPG